MPPSLTGRSGGVFPTEVPRGPEQKGTEETMSAVDLSRVGACVLKHAVTGEVRPDRRRAENVSQHLPRCPAYSHGLEWGS